MAFVALSQMQELRLPAGAYDVRGWEVRTLVDDERVGEVHDLLLDAGGAPRYLDVALGLFRKHVLLPIGQARADRLRRRIWVPGFSGDQFRDIPEYRHDLDRLTRSYERGLVEAYQSAFTGEPHGSRSRPVLPSGVYGPSELEDRVRAAEVPPRIAPLGALRDFRIARGEPDPRGWDVVAADGTRIGTVDELVVDTRAGKVRYFSCAVDEAGLGLEPAGRRVLLPTGYARLDEEHRLVRTGDLEAEDLARLPVYSGDEVSAELEAEVHARLEDGGHDRFYDDPRFSPREFYGPEAA